MVAYVLLLDDLHLRSKPLWPVNVVQLVKYVLNIAEEDVW